MLCFAPLGIPVRTLGGRVEKRKARARTGYKLA